MSLTIIRRIEREPFVNVLIRPGSEKPLTVKIDFDHDHLDLEFSNPAIALKVLGLMGRAVKEIADDEYLKQLKKEVDEAFESPALQHAN